MLPTLRLVNDRVAVRPDVIENTTDSGLVLAKRTDDLPTEGIVIAVGPGQWSAMGERLAMTVEVGDRVTFEPLQAYRITQGDETAYIFDEDQILAIIVEPAPSKRTTPRKRAAKKTAKPKGK